MSFNRFILILSFCVVINPIIAFSGNRTSFSRDKATKTSAESILPGSSSTTSFDEGWLFSRFGLQADGTQLPEPEGLTNPQADDSNWRKLDLPHDWAIEGPFRKSMKILVRMESLMA